MKKVLFVLTIVCVAFAVNAQDAKFGVRLGASYTGYYGADYNKIKDDTESPKWAPTGGFYINSMVSDYFWIKTEFNFVNRGNVFKDQGKTLRSNIYYIDAYPLNAAFHFKGGQLFAGPAVGFAITSNYQDIDSTGAVVTIVDNEMDGYNRLDVGFVAGIEYEFNFGLNLGIRHVRGMSSVFETVSGTPRFAMSNQAWTFTVGYTLGRSGGGSSYSDL